MKVFGKKTERINMELIRYSALKAVEFIRYAARSSWRGATFLGGVILSTSRLRWVRVGISAFVGLSLIFFLFLPVLLFGDAYQLAEKKLRLELTEARQCSLQWRENEGLKSFVMILVALEDRGFFSRSTWTTFDLRGVMRAMVKNISSFKVSEGGSSLQWQVSKLIRGSAVRERSFFNKIMEARLALNLRGSSRDDILTIYSKYIDCGLADEQGLVSCSLNLFGKFPEDLSHEEGASLAAMQSAPSLLRNDPERLNARVAKGIEWLKTQNVNITFAEENSQIAHFGNYQYFRGFQPPSACFYSDRENWTSRKIMAEAFGNVLPEIRKKAVIRSNDQNISIGSLTVAARPPFMAINRIGQWMESTPVAAGSILKPILLELYIKWLGADKTKSIQLPVGLCVLDGSLKPYCPKDIGALSGEHLDLVTAVAKSVNSASVSAVILLPYLIYAESPKRYREFSSILSSDELQKYSLWPDRVLGARILGDILHREINPSELPAELSYRAAQLSSLRRFRIMVREYTGYEIGEYLSSILGAEVKVIPSDIAKAYSRLFFPASDCTASATAELLGMHSADGTLKATIGQTGAFPGKTGTTDYSAIAVIGACITLEDNKKVPVVSVIAATDHRGNSIDPLKASMLGEGFVMVKNEIEGFGYGLGPPKL